MFEGSLVESRGLLASKTRKWTALGSVAVQCAAAALLIVLPMLRPETLPASANAQHIAVPELRQTRVVQQIARAASHAAATVRLPAAAAMVEQTRRFVFPGGAIADENDATMPRPVCLRMGDGSGSLSSLPSMVSAPGGPVAIAPARETGRVRVSQGVLNGMLLAPITPAYPPIAKAAGVQGTVVIEAVISKAGRVESLKAVSGPQMLRSAALDAVKAARYAPYRLNGEPVEVQTVITVVFRLGV